MTSETNDDQGNLSKRGKKLFPLFLYVSLPFIRLKLSFFFFERLVPVLRVLQCWLM